MSCPNTLVVAFDLETTGLNAMNDCIIQLAATVLESHRSLQSRDTFTIYFQLPKGKSIGSGATAVHGITDDHLREVGIPFVEGWSRFLRWLECKRESGSSRKPLALVAHNGQRFDMKMLTEELRRRDLLLLWIETLGDDSCFIDSYQVFRDPIMWQGMEIRPPNKKLGSLYRCVFDHDIATAHNAVSDAEALLDIIDAKIFKRNWVTVSQKLQYFYNFSC